MDKKTQETDLIWLSSEKTDLQKASTLLKSGSLVAFPTETVYGLGADATNPSAIRAVYEAKNRPDINPLILHVTDQHAAGALAFFSPLAQESARRFWPGPLTLVLPRRKDAPITPFACAGLDTVAIRVPAHPIAQKLLNYCERPIAAPSANPSGRLSPTRAAHVAQALRGKITAVIDGGNCDIGVESTIIDVTGTIPVLLRPGGISLEQLIAALGTVHLTDQHPQRPLAPGMMLRHYAPSAPLRLEVQNAYAGEVVLAFGPVVKEAFSQAKTIHSLSMNGDLYQAAASLFEALHKLDALQPKAIAVMPIPDYGLGKAINDRLRRAVAAQQTEI